MGEEPNAFAGAGDRMGDRQQGGGAMNAAEKLDQMIRLAEELRAEGTPILTHELIQVLTALRILRDEVDPLGSTAGRG